MLKFATRAALAAAILSVGVLSGLSGASAQVPGDQAIVGLSTTTRAADVAKVTAIDVPSRKVTIAFADGSTASGTAGDAVINLDKIKVGDTVVATYKQKLSFVLSDPNAKTPMSRNVVGAIGAAPGKRPAGLIAAQDVKTYYVVSANPAANTISLVNPNGGEVRTFNVTQAAAQQGLSRVKPGDKLTVVDTQVLFVGIEKRSA